MLIKILMQIIGQKNNHIKEHMTIITTITTITKGNITIININKNV
jgi:hypothetical protein